MGNTSALVIANVGIPAEIEVVPRSGPFFEPTQVISYYTRDQSDYIRRYDFWLQEDRVVSEPSWRDGEVMVPATKKRNLQAISEYNKRLHNQTQ